MKKREIYLCGGEDIGERTCKKENRAIFSSIEDPEVTVLPSAKGKYREGYIEYFEDLGSSEVNFLDLDKDADRIKEILKGTDLLYIRGGDPEEIVEGIKDREQLSESIRNFKGVIYGNSAGAITLCRRGGGRDKKGIKSYEGLGIVDRELVVHYKEGDEEVLEEFEDNVISLKPNQVMHIPRE